MEFGRNKYANMTIYRRRKFFGKAVWIFKEKGPCINQVIEVTLRKNHSDTFPQVKEINKINRRRTSMPPNECAQNSAHSIELTNRNGLT
jgi:hypothetical protein